MQPEETKPAKPALETEVTMASNGFQQTGQSQHLHPNSQNSHGSQNQPAQHVSQAVANNPNNLHLGRVLGGRYQLLEHLGQGGMSAVYLSRHPELDQLVAIKVLRHDRSMGEDNLKRFLQEAKATYQLNHPNLIRLIDYSAADLDMPYLVMEYVSGKTLSEVLKERQRLDVDEFVNIFTQVCDGLAYAHSKGITHRDLKPSNIMLAKEKDGSELIKIVDFGIAKMAQLEQDQQVTKTGEIFGSPLYMSPEQCKGLNPDHRSDLYSMGCAMFECLSGNVPYCGANTIQTMYMHIEQPVPELNIPPYRSFDTARALNDIVTKLLQKDPNERFQNALDAKKALLDCTQRRTRPSEAAGNPGPPHGEKSEGAREQKKSRWIGAIAAAVTVGIIGAAAAAGLYAFSHRTPEPARSAASQTAAVPHQAPNLVAHAGDKNPLSQNAMETNGLVEKDTPLANEKLAAEKQLVDTESATAKKESAAALKEVALAKKEQAKAARELAAAKKAIAKNEAEAQKEVALAKKETASVIDSLKAHKGTPTLTANVEKLPKKIPYVAPGETTNPAHASPSRIKPGDLEVVKQMTPIYKEMLAARQANQSARAETLCAEAMNLVPRIDKHTPIVRALSFNYLSLLAAHTDHDKNFRLMDQLASRLEELKNDDPPFKPVIQAQVYGWHGHAFMGMNQYEKAYGLFERATQLAAKGGPESDDRWANWYTWQARALEKSGQPDKALALCDKGERDAVNKSPMAMFIFLRTKGYLLWNAGKEEEARKAMKNAKAVFIRAGLDPTSKDVQIFNGFWKKFGMN